MTFHNARLPEAVQFSSTFGAGFQTVIQQTASNHEVRIARQSQARHRLSLVKNLLSDDEMAAVKVFHLRTRGALDSFRAKDWSDYTTASDGVSASAGTDQLLGTGDGSETQFQLVKRYAVGATGEYARTITLPLTGNVAGDSQTLEVRVDGVLQTFNSDYTVTEPGGVITFSTAPALGLSVTAGFEFDIPCRFEKALDTLAGIRADASGVWSVQNLALLEVFAEVEWPERFDPGGSIDLGTVSGDISLSFGMESMVTLTPGGTGTRLVVLPAPPDLHEGGTQIFTLHVQAGTASVQIIDDAGNNVGASFSSGIRVLDLLVSTSTTEWHVR